MGDPLGAMALPENATENDIIREIDKLVKRKWVQSKTYTPDDFVVFSSKEIAPAILESPLFIKNVLYVDNLYRTLSKVQYYDISKRIEDEISQWDDDGGLCIYLSVVMYWLFFFDKLCKKENMNLVQGFVRYPPSPFAKMFNPSDTLLTSFHSWLSVNDCVIDLSIRQEAGFFDFKNSSPIILGKLPEDLIMKGIKEPENTVLVYTAKILNKYNMDFTDWLKEHVTESYNVITKYYGENQ